jgi:hypothetical protein
MYTEHEFPGKPMPGNPTEGSQPKDNSLLVKYFSPAFRSGLIAAKKQVMNSSCSC